MRLLSSMGAAAALLKALTLALCLAGGSAAKDSPSSSGSSKTTGGGGDGISPRVRDMVAKMVRGWVGAFRSVNKILIKSTGHYITTQPSPPIFNHNQIRA